MIFEFAHHLGIVPLLLLGGLLALARRSSIADWWMAAGFGVSWVADTATHWMPHPLVSQLYPITQAALFVFVLSPRRYTEWIVGLMFGAAAVSLSLRDAQGLDILLHVIAWGVVAALAWRVVIQRTLRTALLAYFGLGTLCWLAYVADPGWVSWLAYQGTRLFGVSLWCVAAWQASRRVGSLSTRYT